MPKKFVKIEHTDKPLSGEVEIPGSKSITNRALLLAALSDKKVTIKNALVADDTKAMINALITLGIKVEQKANEIVVKGNIKDVKDKTHKIDADLSGTTIRFLLPLLCIVPGVKILTGKKGLKARPIKDLVDALQSMGAKIEYISKNGFPPLLVRSSNLSNTKTHISGKTSSQYLSALLMILPLIGGGEITVEGDLVSKSYADITASIMQAFGVKIKKDHYKKFIVPGGQYNLSSYKVEGDLSSAAYFAALAALTGSTIKIKNINPKTVQGDKLFLKVLEKMGNKITESSDSITVKGVGVRKVKVDMQNCPDQIQTLAVLASFAKGATEISGTMTLAAKETNRIAALKNELGKMGIKVKVLKNSIIIYGGTPKRAIIETYGDHRTAMSFAIAGAKIPGIVIKDSEVVNKTFPDFWEKFEKIGLNIN